MLEPLKWLLGFKGLNNLVAVLILVEGMHQR